MRRSIQCSAFFFHIFSYLGSMMYCGRGGGGRYYFQPVESFSTPYAAVLGRNRRRSKSIVDTDDNDVRTKTRTTRTTQLNAVHYGRGADIWPECNPDPIQLQDSFPNGNIPFSAILEVDQTDMQSIHNQGMTTTTTTNFGINRSNLSDHNNEEEDDSTALLMGDGEGKGQRRQKARYFVNKTVQRLLRRAAAKEEILNEEDSFRNGRWYQTLQDRLVMIVAAMMVVRGWIRPVDVLVVATLTTYFILLGMIAESPRRGGTGTAPIMPSMPPQGHVPTIVSHPLGIGMNQNRFYDLWLQMGVGLGIILPLISILLGGPTSSFLRWTTSGSSIATSHHQWEATRLCSRPLFLLCCQVMSETYSKRAMVPLPIRILIPISYNIIRLLYLWNWAVAAAATTTAATTTTVPIGIVSRILAITNLGYWTMNLLAFLIPIAHVRYMRAYFFGVEAAEVTTRVGMEETIGLIP